MKKFLVISLAALGLNSVSSAATILCTPSNVNSITSGVIASPLNVTCGSGVTATPGFQITSVALRVIGSWNDAIDNGLHQLTFAATGTSTEAGALSATAITNQLSFFPDAEVGNGQNTGAAGATGGVGSLTSFNVSVATSNTVGGNALPDNASFTVSIITTETAIPSGVPEPSTFALLGVALTGLGVYARRRKA